MGLTFDQLAGDPGAARKERAKALEAPTHPAGDDPDATAAARTGRLEALAASARRIQEELAALKDRKDRLFLRLEPVLRRILEDPSADRSDLDEHFRLGEEVTEQLCVLVRAHAAVDREFAAVEYEDRLARGRAAAAELAGVLQSFAELRMTVAPARVAAGTDASAGGDHESAMDDHD